MDMNSLIHRRDGGGASAASSTASASSIDGFRAPATGVSAFPTPGGFPGLRTHLPSLPIRFPPLHATNVTSTSSAASSSAASSTASPAGPPRSAPSSSSSSGSSSSQQATSLAPLRFIIPSSHCPPSSAFGDNANILARPGALAMAQQLHDQTVSRSFSDPALHGNHGMLHHQSRPSPIEIASAHGAGAFHDGDGSLSTDGSDGRKKSPGKRNRAVKNPNRSTKSKARPGLRKGKWTEEEERYATQLTNYFKEGLLPIERGTMLRLYLSQKLNCEPMRITKKFTGGECIGKQVFRPCSPTPESRIRLMQAQLELVALEAAFIKKLKENKEEVPGLTDDVDGSLAPGAIAVSARPKKRRPYQRESKNGEDDGREETGFTSDSSTASDTTATASQRSTEGKKKGDVDDASAVGLLLDFFYKASKNEDEDDEAKSSAPAATTTPEASAKASSEPEPEHEEEHKVAATAVKKEELVASPTKRMRTLSISQCHTDVISPKRSRVGSFTLVASNPQ
jgi:hypothetical protein